MKCELCNGEASGICPRCYRYVCSNCIDPITMLCKDCQSFKREQERDYIRLMDSIEKKLEFIENSIEKCFKCPILKDEIMRNIRIVKELEMTAKLDGFEELYNRILDLKERVQNIGIRFLVRLKMTGD